MTYVVIVGTATIGDRATELPEPSAILRLDAENRWQRVVNSTASRCERHLRDLAGGGP
jgi:hypothetical protein